MIILLQPKHFNLALFFFLIVSSSSLFHTTHARSQPQPPVSPPSSNDGTIATFPLLFILFFFALIITCFCSIYIRHCSERYYEVVVSPNTNTKGIDPQVLATCPVTSYSAAKTSNRHVALHCAVCLEKFNDLDALRVMPTCGHVFHKACIDTWLASHVTCPVCRGEIVFQTGECKMFDESSVRRIEVVKESGLCGKFDGSVEKCNGSSKVSAFGVLVRSHSTGHSLMVMQHVVEDKGGNLIAIRRSASYDVVLRSKEGGECSNAKIKSNGFGWGSYGIPRFWGSSVEREDKEYKERTIFQVV